MDAAPAETREKEWVNIIFLTLTPIIGVIGTALYTWRNGFEPWMLVLLVAMYLAVGISICAGYHRFFSHKSYECSRPVQTFYAIFGALAAQNSILWWSSAHRIHHRWVDREWDPYNIKRGFWWAHMFWIFYTNPRKPDFENARDLLKNPIVMWQNRWHKVILIAFGFGFPTLIGAAFGDPIAGLLWGGFLRIFVIHHTTFFVNSLAHKLGNPAFDENVSARDNWAVALLTLGEGYHSFHHRFPSDFRNGIRWYQWDPAKWFIATLRATGFARGLRVTAAPVIEEARMEAAMKKIAPHVETAPPSHADEIMARMNAAREAMQQSIALWRQHLEEKAEGVGASWRETRRLSRIRMREARRAWRSAVRMTASLQRT